MSESYYLKVEGQMRGPYSLPQLRRLYLRGFVAPQTPFWQDGMEELQPVEALFARPPTDWRAVMLRTLLAGAVGTVLLVLFLALWRDRILEFADSPEVGEFLRKAIYILFFKQE